MAQDDYIRTALRVPPDLHKALHKAAEESGKSFNAEILVRLRESFASDPQVMAAAASGQASLARAMAQFVITVVNMAGPQPGVSNDVFRLMKETAETVKAGGKLNTGGALGELMVILMALQELPEGRDPEEFVRTVQRLMKEEKAVTLRAEEPEQSETPPAAPRTRKPKP